jgi:polyisoprenoid-binding protein YceI
MPVRYTLDARQSRFTVQAFAGGLLSGFAHNPTITIRDFTGEVQLTPDAPEDAALQMTIRDDALEVTGNVNQRDVPEIEKTMRTEVLETAAYPEIRFRGTAIGATKIADNWYRIQLRGELSLHGVKKVQEVDTQLRLVENEIRLSGEFTLLLSAYRMKRVSAVGGMVTLKDEIKFAFDVVGRNVPA